jgi:hypothetical protein
MGASATDPRQYVGMTIVVFNAILVPRFIDRPIHQLVRVGI